MFSWKPFWKKESVAKDSCYVICSLKNLAFFYLPRQNPENIKEPPVISCFSWQDLEQDPQKLRQWINANQLQNAECHGILLSDTYRLLQLEKPSVPEKEINSALRWLIKDLIDYPIEDTATEAFYAPVRQGQKDKLQVVVTRLSFLLSIQRLLQSVNVNLQQVTPSELIYRNFSATFSEATQSAAFLLKLSDNGTQVLVVHDGLLYMERKIPGLLALQSNPAETTAPQNTSLNSDTILEIQRTLDFYQMQTNQNIPTKLYLDPGFSNPDQILQELQKNLTFPVEIWPTHPALSSLISNATDLLKTGLLLNGILLSPAFEKRYPDALKKQTVNLYSTLPKITSVKFSSKLMLKIGGAFLVLLIIQYGIEIGGKSRLAKTIDALTQQQILLTVQIGNLGAQYDKLSKSADEQLKALLQEISYKEHLTAIFKKRIGNDLFAFSTYLEGLSEAITPNAWLTSFQITQDGYNLSLTGSSYRMEDIIELIQNLKKPKVFQDKPFVLFKVEQPENPKENNAPLNFVLKAQKKEDVNKEEGSNGSTQKTG